MSLNAMKQTEERHVVHKITIMVWCTRMDLVALANSKGEVLLHRLNWQRVWALTPYKDGIEVRAIAWRPDGKFIGIAYNTGIVLLVDIENKDIIHTFDVGQDITCMSWCQQEEFQASIENPSVAYKIHRKTIHDHTAFLPKLPSLTTSYSNKKHNDTSTESKYLKDQRRLNMLCLGLQKNTVYLSVFGLFPCGVVDLYQRLNQKGRVIDVKLSNNFDQMYVFIVDEQNILKIIVIKTIKLLTHSKELQMLALKQGHVINLMNYIQTTISSAVEAWETILLEMDSKLENYSESVPSGGVSSDFLDLLMFGKASIDLQSFLLQDLTEKGLKKLGNSIELSYSTIQKLVLKNLNTAGQALSYHLSELRGMARFAFRYQTLGLDEELVTNAIAASGSFLVKVIEVQQVIDHSMKNYKAFFRWLYVIIVRLMDEKVPNEIVEVSQQELKYIAEFLENIDGTEPIMNQYTMKWKRRPFNLERLGQYLENSELVVPIDTQSNPWPKLIAENECLQEHKSIIKHHADKSLIQQHDHLKAVIDKIYEKPKYLLGDQFVVENIIQCTECVTDVKVTQMNYSDNINVNFALINTSLNSGAYFIKYFRELNEMRGIYVEFLPPVSFAETKLPNNLSRLLPIDIHFYSPEICSILLQQDDQYKYGIFLQLNLKLIYEKSVRFAFDEPLTSNQNIPKVNAFDLKNACSLRCIDYMQCSTFDISPSRKVAIILSSSFKKVRVFEMEAEEDDEEDDNDTTKDNESSLLSQTNESIAESSMTL